MPVHAPLGTTIADVAVDGEQPWARRHLATIEHAYAEAPYFARHRPAIRELYAQKWTKLAPLAVASASWLADAVGIRTPTRLASQIGATAADPTDRLIEICRAVGATTYLAGVDAVEYMDTRRFAAAGIMVLRQQYEHPVYPQIHGDFVPSLSGLDLLLMHGDHALGTLRRGDQWARLT